MNIYFKNYNRFRSEINDEFFYSRLQVFEPVTKFKEEELDNNAKCIIIENSETKTYKVMLDDNCDNTIAEFLVNTCFSIYSLRSSNCTDEYYVNNDEFTFYYFKIGIINAYFLFKRDVSMEDIISTKNELKTIKDRLIK